MENIHQNCESNKVKERCDEPEIWFSVVTAAAGILTKRMQLKDGEVLKDSTGCRMAKGIIKTTTSTPQRFAVGLRKLKPIKAIVHGVCQHDEARVVSRAKLQKEQKKVRDAGQNMPVIARTKEYIDYPDGPGIILFDHDKPRDESVSLDDKTLKSYTPKKLIEVITEIFPGLAGCTWVSTPSTSACIYDSETGNELRGLGAGFHLYFFPKKATDIPRFLEVLGKRLCLAGYSRVEISRSGSLLLRTLVDLSVGSPERFDFVAGAVCQDGLEQRLPEPEYDLEHYLTPWLCGI